MSPSLVCKLALGALVIPSVVLAIPIGSETASDGPELKARATAIKVLLGNDDGWAEANIRQLYADAQAAGYDAVLSAGAKNGSGLSSLDISYGTVSNAEYSSIPDGSPEAGFNQTDPRLNYYNGTPVAAIKYGLNSLTTKFWGGAKPDLVLSGPNVGSNLGAITLLSGTVGVANYALKQGVPSIAFSGGDSTNEAWTTLQPGDTAHLYSQLAMTITKQITSSAPFLPTGVSLNVNFPKTSSNCSTASDFKYVFTTVYPLASTIKCSSTAGTPAEADVIASGECLVSISAMNSSKFDATPAQQTTVFNKLKPILSCADVEDHILSAIFPISSV